jgi:hypothetical protein
VDFDKLVEHGSAFDHVDKETRKKASICTRTGLTLISYYVGTVWKKLCVTNPDPLLTWTWVQIKPLPKKYFVRSVLDPSDFYMDENPDLTHFLADKHRFLIHKLLVKIFI